MTKRLLSLFIVLLGMLGWSTPVKGQNWWDGLTWTSSNPTSEDGGEYFIYNPTHKVFLKAVSTVTSNPGEATLFTTSAFGTEIYGTRFIISYNNNGREQFVFERAGGQKWGDNYIDGTFNNQIWQIESKGNAYEISHNDPEYDRIYDRRIRYIGTNGINVTYPYQNYSNSEIAWYFITEEQYYENLSSVVYFYSAKAYKNFNAAGDVSVAYNKIHNQTSQAATFTATTNPGYTFKGWSTTAFGGTILSTSESFQYTISSTSHDHEQPGQTILYAIYEKNEGAVNTNVRFVTYNVDGLPANTPVLGININDNCPAEAGTKKMGEKLAALSPQPDFIAVQEDFNYDQSLAEGLGSYFEGNSHGAFEWSEVALLQGKIKTDGLNAYWKNGRSIDSETATQWGTTYGNLNHGFDQNLLKGFRYYRMQANDQEGNLIYIDVFNLHGDADSGQQDIDARNEELKQLADAVKAVGPGRPKVVLGDFNARYTREKIKENFIDRIEDEGNYAVKDAWVEWFRQGIYPTYYSSWSEESNHDLAYNKIDNNNYNSADVEVVDKILYINPTSGYGNVALKLTNFHIDTSFNYDDKLDQDGDPEILGDHYPVIADFEVIGEMMNEEADWLWIGDNPKWEEGKTEDFYLYNDKYEVNGKLGNFIHAQASGTPYQANAEYDNATLFRFHYDRWGTYRVVQLTFNDGGIKYLAHNNGSVQLNDGRNFRMLQQEDPEYYNFRSGVSDASSIIANSQFRYIDISDNNTGEISFPKRENIKLTNASEWWKIISQEQMNVYKKYKAAVEKAMEILENEEITEAANPEIHTNLFAEVYTAKGRNYKSSEVADFIALVDRLCNSNIAVNEAAKYGTFVAPYPVKVRPGMKAYTVKTQENTSVLALADCGSYIKANTPVVLFAESGYPSTNMYGDPGAETNFELDDTRFIINHTNHYTVLNNDLTGTLVRQQVTDKTNAYLLQNQDGLVAFYRCNPQKTYWIGKNRAWLTKDPVDGNVDQLNNVKTFYLFEVDDNTDAIHTNFEPHAQSIFDLSGRKIENITRGGVYIINGKKVIR